ncbi:hypothetical protein LAZ67_3001322 [Cordylochernes scorpioides]|uniref:Uncharacterized protein n=1 Tax=Cordylochernes scorpioides TaxID=51811 RepID=A0ABY6K8F8_9ARAC|nr:hypothetical protein LAZ67_3001322 [Cordylochernes scorpioides]
MEAARAFLEMHRRDGDQLFSRIVTGDESWVHHSTPETKRKSMVWKKPEESAPKKGEGHNLGRKSYGYRLLGLAAIKRKRPGLLSRKVLLVHDNPALTQLERPKRCWKTSNGKFSHIHLILRNLPHATSIFFQHSSCTLERSQDITDFPVTKSRQDSGRQGTSKQIDHCLYRKMEQGREEESKEPMKTDPDSESGGSPTFPKKETTFGKTQEIVPGQEDVTPPPPVSDVLGRLTTTLPQLSAVTGHRERWNRYDGSYKAQSFFTNYDAQADRAQLQYSTSLKKPPDLLQAPLRVTNTRASIYRYN